MGKSKGYTVENGKIVIWTEKRFVSDKYPFNDEGENHTYFYKNLRDNNMICECLSRLSDDEKKLLVSNILSIQLNAFILKSKKNHYKKIYKK